LVYTPKALANFSPGLERSDNPGIDIHFSDQPWKGSPHGKPFQGLEPFSFAYPGLERSDNPGGW